MPSFLKKLLLGKDLSNPYVNKYHPGHRATPQPTQHVPAYVAQAASPHPTSATLSTRIPPRPASPTYLEEARRLAGRHPVTGQVVVGERAEGFAEGSARGGGGMGRGESQRGGGGGVAPVGRQVGGGYGGQVEGAGVSGDGVAWEGRRRLEEERILAERLREREVGGYFAPERSVREYYGGS